MDEEIRIHCNQCSRTKKHTLIYHYEVGDEDEVEDWDTVRCIRCNTLSFQKRVRQQTETGWETIISDIYPPRRSREVHEFPTAPATLDQIYRETIDAFNSGSHLLCGGGLRALVEGICADKGVVDGPDLNQNTGVVRTRQDGSEIRGTSLKHKIDGLAEQQLLLPQQASILHEHRYMGNEALHDLDRPSGAVLNAAIDVIETIMVNLYNLQAQGAQLALLRRPALVPNPGNA